MNVQLFLAHVNTSTTLDLGSNHLRLPSVLGSSRRLWAEILPRLDYSNRGRHTSTWPVYLSGPTARHSQYRPSSPSHLQFTGAPILALIFISGDGQRSRSCGLLGDFSTPIVQGACSRGAEWWPF